MFHLHESDFQPLAQSQLAKMLTDRNEPTIPAFELAQIRVFRPEKAQLVEQKILPGCQRISRYLFETIPNDPLLIQPFKKIERMQCREFGPSSQQAVTHWLASLEIEQDALLLLSWETTIAAAVPSSIFRRYWIEFWEDDLCVCTLSGDWYLLLYHEGVLLAGQVEAPHEALLVFQQKSPVQPLTAAARNEILRLLQAQKKVEAIKLYHKETGSGLKEAKDAVNTFEKEMKRSLHDE